MEFQVQLISRTITKPSSPTPDHLRHYKLSYIDQISPPVYNGMVFFYPFDGDNKFNNLERFNQLEQSLSEALTRFYPLAGRLKGNLYVDCNDEGIPFQQAQVKCKLYQVLEDPVPGEINKLLPFELDCAQDLLSGIQFNVFECGGIGIGVCISHKIADASSFFMFVKSWAAMTRSDQPDEPLPEFASATLFPPRELYGYDPSTPIAKENTVAKRFIFSNSSIKALIAKYSTSREMETQQSPSRIQLLSTFIWSRIVASTLVDSGTNRLYELLHMVNLRPRMQPPLSEYTFGNIFWHASTNVASINSKEQLLINLANQMRESICKIDKEYVKLLQVGDQLLASRRDQPPEILEQGEVVNFSFSNWCWFPIYEADFGWGNPIRASPPSMTFKNTIVFVSTVSGEGIEAFVHLTKEDMAKFQEDKELLDLIAPTGS